MTAMLTSEFIIARIEADLERARGERAELRLSTLPYVSRMRRHDALSRRISKLEAQRRDLKQIKLPLRK